MTIDLEQACPPRRIVTHAGDRIEARVLNQRPREHLPGLCTRTAGKEEARLRCAVRVGCGQQVIDHLSVFDLSALHARQLACPYHDDTLRSAPAAAKTTPISPATAPNSTA